MYNYNFEKFHDELIKFMQPDFLFLRKAFFYPYFEENQELIENQMHKIFSLDFIKFLKIIKKHYFLNQISRILREMISYLDNKFKEKICTIEVVKTPDLSEREEIEQKISNKFGHMTFNYIINPKIVGGLIIYLDGKIFNLSLLNIVNKIIERYEKRKGEL